MSFDGPATELAVDDLDPISMLVEVEKLIDGYERETGLRPWFVEFGSEAWNMVMLAMAPLKTSADDVRKIFPGSKVVDVRTKGTRLRPSKNLEPMIVRIVERRNDNVIPFPSERIRR